VSDIVKKEAADAGRSFGNAASQASRIGGPAGGALGRSIGGFSQGFGAGALGLGLAGGGMLLNAFLQRDAERVSRAKDSEARSQARAGVAQTAMERADQRAAGGMQFMGAARRIISRGTDSNAVRQSLKGGSKYGLNTGESLTAMDAAQRLGVSELDVQMGMATGLVGDNAEEVANNIQKFNGLNNAVQALQGMTARAANDAIDRTLTDRRSGALSQAGAAMNPVMESQLQDLFSGKTADAMQRQAWKEMNPLADLSSKAAMEAQKTVEQLRAAADAQGTIAALLAEMGRVVGLSEGSASRQFAEGANAAGGG
jgi:hypothetical protein